MELVVRREGFAARFGGLRYEVRGRVLMPDGLHDVERRWDFDLGTWMRQDVRGWYFDFIGERVSSPVAYAVHTDGRVGVTDGGPFMEIASSLYHLIEHHAVADHVASWIPWRAAGSYTGSGWVALVDDLAARLEGLVEVPEASGPCARWLLGADVAIRDVLAYTSDRPRARHVAVWVRSEHGLRQIQEAIK
jgi:hypothetical protein